MIVVEQTKDMTDLSPILDALNNAESQRSTAEAVVQNIIGALFVRMRAGVSILGPGAGPWMAFAERLAAVGSDRSMLAARALVATATDAL
jgi:hypothetical protein